MTKSQTFGLDWPELGLIKVKYGKSWGKFGFQEPGVVTHSFYVQLLLINLYLVLIVKSDQKPNFRP